MVLGNQIVTQAGHCPVRLKGVDVPGLEWSNTGDGPSGPNKALTTVQYAVNNWACNFVRLPLNQDRWMGTACASTASSYQALVQQIVDWCNSNDVYVLLDLHWSDLGVDGGGNVCSSGQHDMPDDNSLLFWQSVASTAGIANNPAVFFDLYNEPGGATGSSALSNNSTGWGLWRNGGTVPASADGTAYHTPGMQALLAGIRAAGANNMVWAGGRNWAFNLNGLIDYSAALTDTASGNGVVYATHIYPFKLSGNGCVMAACFDSAVPQAVMDAYPVMVTEFGPNVGDPEGFLSPLMDWINLHNLSFSAWCMHPSAAPCLISDWAFTPTSYFGAPFLNKLLGTNPLGCNPATATVSPTISPTPTVTITPTAVPACGDTVLYRINCGGPAWTDSSGAAWSADSYYSGGSTSSTTITVQGTADPTLFMTNRWANPLNYSFPVPNGDYRVELLESENYWTAANKRRFNINLQASTVEYNYDVYASTGGLFKAAVLSYNVTVSNGTLSVQGAASIDNAQFAGIRITLLGPACSPTPTVSATNTPSPTISPTWTASPIVSPTPSATISPTWTVSPTVTVTPSISPTFTPVPDSGDLKVLQVVGLPNPNPRFLRVRVQGSAERLELDLYSTAYSLVLRVPQGAAPSGYSDLHFPADWYALPNGLYFAQVQAWRGGEHDRSKPVKLLILR